MKYSFIHMISPRVQISLFILLLMLFLWRQEITAILFDVSDPKNYACETTQEAIGVQIITANYCAQDSDCTTLKAPCPFGCNTYGNYIHGSEQKAIMLKIQNYSSQCGICIYDCDNSPPSPQCIDNLCVSR